MEENSKKRSRKTKLVPRQYLDSDDENIALMQQEIEEELANIRAQSLLKKLSSQPKTDIQFSVNVKVEEYDEELTDEEIFSIYNDLDPENVKKETILESTKENPEDCFTETISSSDNEKEENLPELSQNFESDRHDDEVKVIELSDEEISSTYNDLDPENVKKETILEPTKENPEDCFTETISSSDNEKEENLPELSQNFESDRHEDDAQDTNIRIESVRSLKDIDKIEVKCYQITKSMIKKEFEIFSKTTTSDADKLLEIHIRNYFGHYIPEVKLNRTEMKIQEVLNRWRTWLSCYSLLRDTPLMYICSSCKLAWWYLHEFREHIKYHRKFVFNLYTQKHKSYIVVACSISELRYREVAIGSNCWRCGRNVTHHRDEFFKCDGCERFFETCLLLTMHEGDCEGNRKFYRKAYNNTYIEFKCPVCPWKHWNEKELTRHLLGLHMVRSDLPIFFRPTKCVKCNHLVYNFSVHKCALEPIKEPCGFCFRKFRSKTNLSVHNMVSRNNFECRVCKKHLEKVCMEFEHLLEHTDNYKMLYMCLVCKDSLCFLDQHSVKYHTSDYHINKEKVNEKYCQIVVPKSLLERLKPMKMLIPPALGPEENDKTPEVQNVDTVCESPMENTNSKTVENGTVKTPDEDFERNIQITIINKKTVQKIMDSIPSEEALEVIKNIKEENVEDVNDNSDITSVKNNDNIDLLSNKSITDVESKDDEDVSKDCVTVDVTYIKEEPMDIDESNEINESNGINESNDTELTDNNGNNDINIQNEMNDDNLESELETMDEIYLPIKLEIKEEREINYEDEMIVINEDNLSGAKKTVDRSNGKYYIEKYMAAINGMSRYLCTKCDSTFKSFKKYLMHFVQHDYKPLTCPKCMKIMSTQPELMCHVTFHIKLSFLSVHSIGNDLSDNKSKSQCKKCHLLVSLEDFFKHWESHLEIQSAEVTSHYTMDMDGKPNLKEMLALLTDPDKIIPTIGRTNQCMECGKRFERKNDLKRHFIEHLLKDAYVEKHKYGCLKCQICGQEFNSSDRYKRHLREHASLPLYKCDLCDKAFSDSSNFSKHKKVHNLSVLVCNLCKKKFQKKQYLIKHLEMHEVTKPIVCKTCDKIFYSQSVYSKHLKKNRPRFKCHICMTSYETLREKWDHMWQIHKERKFEADCPICKKSYRKYADVKKHIREEHENVYHNYYNKAGRKLPKVKRDNTYMNKYIESLSNSAI